MYSQESQDSRPKRQRQSKANFVDGANSDFVEESSKNSLKDRIFSVEREAHKRQRADENAKDEESEFDSDENAPSRIRISASSKVNFSKLSNEEKELRC